MLWQRRVNYIYLKTLNFVYTGWPRKNATPTITNFKEIRHQIKLLSALMSKTFFFQQNDTKVKDFDEGVLILGQFF